MIWGLAAVVLIFWVDFWLNPPPGHPEIPHLIAWPEEQDADWSSLELLPCLIPIEAL